MSLGEKNCMDCALWRQWLSPAQEGSYYILYKATYKKQKQTNKQKSVYWATYELLTTLHKHTTSIAEWIIPALLINKYFAVDKNFVS